MKLSRRVTLLTAPVIIFSYLVVAGGFFIVQKRALHQTELARMQHMVEQLRSAYQSYYSFAETYLFSVENSENLRNFVRRKGDSYSELALLGDLEASINNLLKESDSNASFTVYNAGLDVLYFFESSDNPFSDVKPVQKKEAESLIQGGQFYSAGLFTPEENALLIASRALDARTFLEPMSGTQDHWLILQVAVEMSRFSELRKTLENTYSVNVRFVSDAGLVKSADQESLYVPFGNQLALTIPIPNDLGSDAVRNMLFWLVAGLISIVVLTVSVLNYLLRSRIIRPVVGLDNTLSRVMEGHQNHVTIHQSHDEIGHLSIRIQQLHEQLMSAYKEARQVAETDPLTHLPNRLAFYDRANEVIAACHRQGETAAVCYIDLDNFKYVNDKYGHGAGDFLLIEFSQALLQLTQSAQNNFRDVLISRLAGDEFAVLAWPASLNKIEKHIAHPILEVFTKGCMTVEKTQYPVTVSLGIAVYPQHGKELNTLISSAYTAMYQAKALGKNQCAIFSEEVAGEMLRRRAIEDALRTVQPDSEFYLTYMPVIEANSGMVTGAEALLRWKSKKLGLVPPNEFVPVAEKMGLYHQIDEWVIAHALTDFKRLKDIAPELNYLSINLSSAQLTNLDLMDHISRHVGALEIPPEMIEFEITETYELEYHKEEHPLIFSLHQAGFQLAIDDFGTGYTSLMKLLQYPVNKIKLDRKFVEKTAHPSHQYFLNQVIEMCHAMGMVVTAEGIETPELAQTMREAGCDKLQGYHIARPMTLEQFSEWMQD